MNTDRLLCSPENAQRFYNWLQTRGGIAVWESVNLSNPGASWSAPVNDADGKPKGKPTWEAGDAPTRIVTDAAEIAVQVDKVVRVIPIFVRRKGMHIVLTDACTRKVRDAVAKAGPGAYYLLDSYEARIMAPDGEPIPLVDYLSRYTAPASGE